MSLNYITLQMNGEPFTCQQDISLQDILDYLEINKAHVIVEHNQEIIQYQEIDRIILKDGDELELMTIVGGG